MASRKEQKEQARAARIAKQQELASNAQRNRRFQIFGGVAVAAIIVIVVAIVVSSSGSANKNTSTGLPTTGASTRAIQTAVDAELSGIPQKGTTLGDPSAPVTMTYFGDLQCPICREFTLDILPQFIADQVRPGNVKVQYRSFCTASCNNTSVSNPEQLFKTQQVAADAAGQQNHFWDYAELFYHEQGQEDTPYVTSSYLEGLAKQITGLNLTTWQTDRTDPALLDQVDADLSTAQQEGLQGTPTLIMSGKKGSEIVEGSGGGLPAYGDLAAAVKAVS
jgi:protein-disulfide isomerase